MNVKAAVVSIGILSFLIVISLYFIQAPRSNIVNKVTVANKNSSNAPNSQYPTKARRKITQLPIDSSRTPIINALTLPEFVVDASKNQFSKILEASEDTITQFVEAKIVSQVDAMEIPVRVTPDPQNKKFMVRPKQIPNFKPGLYKVSIKARTLSGIVNIDQDFEWGVLAFNTKKSIYEPGEKVDIGMAVLDNNGETMCYGGFDHIQEVIMTITSPSGVVQNFSTENKTITDSGECGSTSFTSKADFQAIYSNTKEIGVYQVRVSSKVKNIKREIEDYFKVEKQNFSVERTSFPTRIYPYSVYPVTFTVTSKTDYIGEVTDLVPGFFEINKLSDNGIIHEEYNFKRLKWQVVLRANVPKTFTYFIKFPLVSPEFYLVGPIKIGGDGFVESRLWQIASDAINSTSGVVTYEDNGASATWYRTWDGTQFSGQTNMDTSPADSRWFKEVSSPKTGEKIVALQDNVSGADRLFVFRYDGANWNEDMNLAMGSTATDETRSFDVVYEELSGEALLVYSDGSSNQLLYYHRTNGSWDGPHNAGTAYDTYKRWVRMEAQFESDTILVGYLNNNERIGAMIWDGSTDTFTSQLADDSGSTTRDSTEQSFDIAWETQSNTPMIFWSTSGNDVIYRELTSGTWQSEATLYSGFSNDVEWVTAAADPRSTSDYIAFAFQVSDWNTSDTTTPCEFGLWDGTSTVSLPSSVTCRSDNDGRLFNVKFENDTGKAVWVYGISESGTSGNTPHFRTWTLNDGYSSDGALSGNLSGNIESIQLYADLNTTSMIMLTCDSAGDLNHFEWDGTSWSGVTTDLHSNIQNAGENAEAYGFGFDRNLEKQVAYRWFENYDGTSVVTPIASQDTPALLTSPNQQFRLRLLIYTSDTLPVNFRQYKLQYVDPGEGTCASPSNGSPNDWTDVPSSGGTTISFYNNTSIVDGDNLTGNGTYDPVFEGLTVNNQDYEEANNFTNSVSQIDNEELGMWDFSLVDNTSYDRVSQTYCFRVTRSNNLVLQIGLYPQISTAAVDDVMIQGGTQIDGGTSINNP